MGYLLRSINLLNILLAAAVVATAHYIVFPLVDKKPDFSPPAIKALAKPTKNQMAAGVPTAAPIDYTVIADQNVFHPDRKIPVDKPQEKNLPKPELVLYGTLITDNVSLAYVEDKKAPLTTTGRGKRLRVLKRGDTMSGFALKSIEPDRIVLARGEEVMTVTIETKHRTKDSPVPPVPAAGSQGVKQPNAPRMLNNPLKENGK
jgi:hypothetical protein